MPRRTAPALILLALLVAGCGSSSSPTAGSPAGSGSGSGSSGGPVAGQVTVLAAASLTGAFTELGSRFEQAHPGTSVRFSFGASSTLAQQVLQGAPADVFAAASPATMAQVTGAGAATGPRSFATNAAEIAVAPDRADDVRGLADLARPDVKVALCQPQVPCGALAQAVLGKAGVTVHPVTQGLDVKSTLAYVTGGEVDAALVYVTDVKAAGSAVRGVEVPAADRMTTDYPIAVVKASQNATAAQAFEDLVLSETGRAVLRGEGFGTP